MHHSLAVLESYNQEFSADTTPLLQQLKSRWRKEKPLTGISIIHNIPLTFETLVKLESLIAAGAELTVTHVNAAHFPPKAKAVSILQEANIPFIPDHEKLSGSFDIALDCAAQIANLPQISLRVGLVEITQIGTKRLRKHPPAYPAISVDDSQTKTCETMFGTGDAFIRAMQSLITNEDLNDKSFLLFGYGKVGQGICAALKPYTNQIVVIEPDPEKCAQAQSAGLSAIASDNLDEMKAVAAKAFCIVSATGKKHIVSTMLKREDCHPNCHFANMGGADEFGENFQEHEMLYGKASMNFSLEHPTLIQYLDPVFYAHNLCAELLLKQTFEPGYHPLPNQIDQKIVADWKRYHGLDI